MKAAGHDRVTAKNLTPVWFPIPQYLKSNKISASLLRVALALIVRGPKHVRWPARNERRRAYAVARDGWEVNDKEKRTKAIKYIE